MGAGCVCTTLLALLSVYDEGYDNNVSICSCFVDRYGMKGLSITYASLIDMEYNVYKLLAIVQPYNNVSSFSLFDVLPLWILLWRRSASTPQPNRGESNLGLSCNYTIEGTR